MITFISSILKWIQSGCTYETKTLNFYDDYSIMRISIPLPGYKYNIRIKISGDTIYFIKHDEDCWGLPTMKVERFYIPDNFIDFKRKEILYKDGIIYILLLHSSSVNVPEDSKLSEIAWDYI